MPATRVTVASCVTQVMFRVLTFFLNAFTLRFVSKELIGVVNVRYVHNHNNGMSWVFFFGVSWRFVVTLTSVLMLQVDAAVHHTGFSVQRGVQEGVSKRRRGGA